MKKNFLIGMVALAFAVSPFLFATSAGAEIDASSDSTGEGAAAEDTSHGLKGAAAAAGIKPANDIADIGEKESINKAIGYVIGQVLTFVGVIFLILMVYGGLQWMIGAKSGKEDDIQKAQKVLYGAIGGMVIVFASYAVTAFVINILTKAGGTAGG